MTAEVNALILLAQCNESKGFYRRALRLWQEISTHFDATKDQCRLAWEKISACYLQLQINTPRELVTRDSRKQDVERGRDADLVIVMDCQIPADDLIVHFF